jgi:hypothetical protein
MRWMGHVAVMGVVENNYILGQKLQGKKPLERFMSR